MSRIQIIILSFMAVLLASFLSGQNEKDFKTDYDLRFICSLKVDINKSPVKAKLRNSDEQKELKYLIKRSACSENSQFKSYKNSSLYSLENLIFISSIGLEDNLFNSHDQLYQLSSRSPPNPA